MFGTWGALPLPWAVMSEMRFRCLFFFDFCGNVLESTREYDAKSWGVSSFVCLRQMQSDGFVFLQPYSCVNFNRIVQWVLSCRISNTFSKQNKHHRGLLRYESIVFPSCVHEKHMWHCGRNSCILISELQQFLWFLHVWIFCHFIGIVSRLSVLSRIVIGWRIGVSYCWIARCADCQDPKMRNARTLGPLTWVWSDRCFQLTHNICWNAVGWFVFALHWYELIL